MLNTPHLFATSTAIVISLVFVLQNVVAQGHRVSQTRCAEYRAQSSQLTGFNCNNTRTFLADHELGGADAEPGEFPHQALLGWHSGSSPESIEFNCGGSLISPQHVLTSAVCVRDPPQIVRLGSINLEVASDNQRDYEVDSVVKHPQHSFRSAYHDVAVIKLKQPVEFTPFIKPACIGVNSTGDEDSTVLSTGFGVVSFGGERNVRLRKVPLDFLPRPECVQAFGDSRRFKDGISPGQLCIGSVVNGQDTCQTDSGSPVQRILDASTCFYNIVGVDSIATPCGVGLSPEIYTNVEEYLDWIESVVWS